jgi:hypothetical protein
MLRKHFREQADAIKNAVASKYITTLSKKGQDDNVANQYLLHYTQKLIGRVLDSFPQDVFYVRIATTEPNYRMYLDLKDFIYLLHTLKSIISMQMDEMMEMPNLTVWYMEATNRRWSMAIAPPRRNIDWKLGEDLWSYRGIALKPWEYTGMGGVDTDLQDPDDFDLSDDQPRRIGSTMPIGTSAIGIKQVIAPDDLTFNESRDISVRVMESTSYAPVVFKLEEMSEEKALGTGTVLGLNVNTIGSVIQALYPDPYRHSVLGRGLGTQYRQDGNILWDYSMAADYGAEWPNEDVTSIVPIVYS